LLFINSKKLIQVKTPGELPFIVLKKLKPRYLRENVDDVACV
jgi:hypothetical protein